MSTLFGSGRAPILVRVAVERGIDAYPDGLIYSLPPELSDVTAGDRVLVPLGRGDAPTAGYVIDQLDPADLPVDLPPAERIKAIRSRDPGGVSLPPKLLELARWVSSYYVCPIGLTLSSVLPAAVKRQVGTVSRRLVDLATEAPREGGAEDDPPCGEVRVPASPTEAHPSAPTTPTTPATQPTQATQATQAGNAPAVGASPRRRSPRRLSPQQAAVLDHLRGLPPEGRPVEIGELATAVGLSSHHAIDSLVRRGLLTVVRRSTVEARWQAAAQLLAARGGDGLAAPTLTDEQRNVLASIGSEPGTHLLFGVTGSGKTEIYLRLIERTLAAGRMALLLVPEIALTPQSGGRVVARFPDHRVAILHSGLTAAQRHVNWAMVAQGHADIVLGARSAVFAPVPAGRLGLIVIDEEHDASYKQDQAPRYHGRDVAIRRAQLEGCPIVLGSATPSLESWHNATVAGRYSLHRLTRRAPGLTVPQVQIVDFVEERRRRAAPPNRDRRVHLLGPRLEAAIGQALRQGGQILLLLNRRGWGNYIACPDRVCGWFLQCDHCDATMVCHLDPRTAAGRYVRCHHCQAEKMLPARCPRCENHLTVFGFGTQRVEEELHAKFPTLVSGETMLRVDADTMDRGADLHDALGRFADGSIRLLVGTQMIAKGLDFPGVTLVGVVNADTALALPDFRAAERTFQLVAQVAGRCGRGSDPGLALVQSFQPTLAVLEQAARGDYVAFAEAELEDRQRAGLPPSSRMVRIVVRHADPQVCATTAGDLATALRRHAAECFGDPAPGEDDSAALPRTIRVRGPAPCTIPRIADRYRQQVELFARTPGPLQKLLAAARTAGTVRPGELMQVDVDPVN